MLPQQKHGRRGQPKDRWVWVSEDLKALQWRAPTGERKPRGTLPMKSLLAVLRAVGTRIVPRDHCGHAAESDASAGPMAPGLEGLKPPKKGAFFA